MSDSVNNPKMIKTCPEANRFFVARQSDSGFWFPYAVCSHSEHWEPNLEMWACGSEEEAIESATQANRTAFAVYWRSLHQVK